MKIVFLLIGIGLGLHVLGQDKGGAAGDNRISLINLETLMRDISEPSQQMKIYNFWASWCRPCVAELRHFQQAADSLDVEVTLVSLDFPEDLQKASMILSKQGVDLPSFLLNEKNYDLYIRSIAPQWSGAIPATLFVKGNGERIFIEEAINGEKLEEIVKNLTSK